MASNVYNFPARRRASSGIGKALSGDGGDGTFDPMEQRVARLEEDVREIRSDLKGIRADLMGEFKALRADMAFVRSDMGEIRGRMSQIPGIWPIVTLFVGIFAMVIGGFWAILKAAG